MEERFIPDYSKHETEFLVDVYSRIDRDNNPLKAQALDAELKKRFNLSPEAEIDSEVVLSFLSTYQKSNNENKKILDKNEEMIKQGWIAGVIIGSLSFLIWFIAMLKNDTSVNGIEITAYSIIDIFLIFGLSYGIFRKSRISAIILTVYFFFIKMLQLLTIEFPQNLFAILGLIIILPFFIRSVIGTVQYHSASLEKSAGTV